MTKQNMPIGTRVRIVNSLEAESRRGTVWITRSAPWELYKGKWVVLLKGYSGGFSLDCLEIAEEQ